MSVAIGACLTRGGWEGVLPRLLTFSILGTFRCLVNFAPRCLPSSSERARSSELRRLGPSSDRPCPHLPRSPNVWANLACKPGDPREVEAQRSGILMISRALTPCWIGISEGELTTYEKKQMDWPTPC